MLRLASVAALVAALLIPLAPAPVAWSAAITTTLVEPFDAGASRWSVAGGKAALSDVTGSRTQGVASMRVAYDVSGGSLNLAPRTSAVSPELDGLPRSLSLDVRGDASWNVLYLQVRDTTGEIFHYRLGNLSFDGWRTLSIEPGRSRPAATLAGNRDGILDLPIHVYRLVIDRNGAAPPSSTIEVDALRYGHEAVAVPSADAQRFVPSAGQRSTIGITLAEAGAARLDLTDERGTTRTFQAELGGGATRAVAWDGRAGDGSVMRGSVRAKLTVSRAGDPWQYGIPYLAGLPARYEPAQPGSIAGINATLTTINTVDRQKAESQAQLMEGAYVRWVREGFDWNQLEPRPGWFEWAKFDQAVEVARAHNVEVLGTLEYSARWASSAPDGASSPTLYPPKDPADFANYARAVVRRYKDRVHVWEVWNEQNSSIFWRPSPSPAAYAELLKQTYAAIKAEDPTATVLLGGTVGFDRPFLDALRAAGAWSSFDVLAIHTYVKGRPESSIMGTWIDNAKAYVGRHGAKPIWITEFGWSTYTGSGTGYIGVSEANQAAFTARAFLMAAQAGVEGMFSYSLMEAGNSSTSKLDNYGMVQLDGRKKPVYAAYRRVAEALDGATLAGRAHPGSGAAVTANGLESTTGWTAAPLGGGTASLSRSTVRHGGSASIRLAYAFTSSSTGVELRRNLRLPGSPTSVSVWVYGDGSANPVYLKVADATGETFQAAVGTLQKGWQRLTLQLDGADPNWRVRGGDGDRRLDYPLTLRSIFVFRAGIGVLKGWAQFDDVQVATGTSVRGVVLSRRGGISQTLYTLRPASKTSVPVVGSAAWLVNGDSSSPLAVTSGRVSVGVSGMPVNVLSRTGLSVATVTPNGDGQGDWTALQWPSGDQTRYRLEVLSSSGSLLRTVTATGASNAGIAAARWDGRIAGAPASPGSYLLRLVVTGPDGRTSRLQQTVNVK